MGVSAAKFNSAGQTSEHYIPGVYSRDKNESSDSGVSTGKLCIVGSSVGGEPLKLLKFGDVTEARNALIDGELLNGVAHAFTGSKEFIPQYVYAMRVNKGTQSKSEFKNGESIVIRVTSADFGSHTNQIKRWLDDGTDKGKKITVSYKKNSYSVDNIEKPSFSILYAGDSENGARCSIGSSGLTLASENQEENLSVSFDEITTLDALVSRINDTGFYSAQLLDKSENVPTKELDHIENAELLTKAVVFKSDVQALADALKSIDIIGSVTIGDNRVMPENDIGFEYFSGAEAGTSLIGDYIDALEVLETEDVQILAATTTNKNVHVLLANHCVAMSGTQNKRERTFFVGMPSSTSIAEGIAEAKSLNTELGSVVIDSANANNPLSLEEEIIPPAMLACKAAGMEAAVNCSVPLTNKEINVNSFIAKRKPRELEEMIANGIMPFGTNEQGKLVCIRGMTTFQGDNLVKNERSMTRAVLYMNRDLRKAFSPKTGSNEEPCECSEIDILKRKAASWYTDDLITKTDDDEYVFNAKVHYDGDKTYLTYDRFVRAPRNFHFITATNRVYRSTVLLN